MNSCCNSTAKPINKQVLLYLSDTNKDAHNKINNAVVYNPGTLV